MTLHSWAIVENIAIVICATVLCLAFDSYWPMLLLLFANSFEEKTK